MVLKALLTSGLLLAVAWDADGNPSTDNLPHAVMSEGVDSSEASSTVNEDGGCDDLPRRPWTPRRWRRLWRASPETARRSIVVAERGP